MVGGDLVAAGIGGGPGAGNDPFVPAGAGDGVVGEGENRLAEAIGGGGGAGIAGAERFVALDGDIGRQGEDGRGGVDELDELVGKGQVAAGIDPHPGAGEGPGASVGQGVVVGEEGGGITGIEDGRGTGVGRIGRFAAIDDRVGRRGHHRRDQVDHGEHDAARVVRGVCIELVERLDARGVGAGGGASREGIDPGGEDQVRGPAAGEGADGPHGGTGIERALALYGALEAHVNGQGIGEGHAGGGRDRGVCDGEGVGHGVGAGGRGVVHGGGEGEVDGGEGEAGLEGLVGGHVAEHLGVDGIERGEGADRYAVGEHLGDMVVGVRGDHEGGVGAVVHDERGGGGDGAAGSRGGGDGEGVEGEGCGEVAGLVHPDGQRVEGLAALADGADPLDEVVPGGGSGGEGEDGVEIRPLVGGVDGAVPIGLHVQPELGLPEPGKGRGGSEGESGIGAGAGGGYVAGAGPAGGHELGGAVDHG